MKVKKLQGIKESDQEWIKEIAENLLEVNHDDLSVHQKKMLRANT